MGVFWDANQTEPSLREGYDTRLFRVFTGLVWPKRVTCFFRA